MNTEKIAILGHVDDGLSALSMDAIRNAGHEVVIVEDEPKTVLLPYIATELFRGETTYDLPHISSKTLKQSTMNQRKRRKLGRQNPHSKYAK